MTKDACDAANLEYEEFSVASSNEIQSVVESAVGKVDCIYAFTDNTIAAGMNTVSMVANENKLPVICGEEGMVEAGGLCTYTISYYDWDIWQARWLLRSLPRALIRQQCRLNIIRQKNVHL